VATVIKEEGNNEDKQLDMFLVICLLYRRPVLLEIERNLYLKMVSHIVEHPKATAAHATGFMKAAFDNDISLVGCSNKALRAFDDKFGTYFDSFYTRLYEQLRLESRPFRVLHHTCMFLSQPVISYLKNKTEPTAFLPP
jgi:hypothetical protein